MREKSGKFACGIKQLISRRYGKFVLLIALLCVLLFASILLALFMDSSMARLLSNCCPPLQRVLSALRRLINIKAVLKVGEAVGICSFLIAWIHAELDKQELGFRYSELLQELYPGYYWFVFLHLMAFVVCMWMGKAGRLEPAVLALLILLLGGVLQWFTLKNLILFTPNRVKIAMDRWSRLVSESGENENKNLLNYIYKMAGVIFPETDDCYRQMFSVFRDAVAQYISGLVLTTPDEWEAAVRDAAKIWATLLNGCEPSDRELLVTGVFDSWDEGRSLNVMSIGYLLWLYDQSIENGLANEDALLAVSKDVTALKQRFYEEKEQPHSFLFYMEAAFTIFVWMHLLCGTIGIYTELFRQTPSEAVTEEDKPLLRGAAQAVFTQKSCQKYLELVLHVLS